VGNEDNDDEDEDDDERGVAVSPAGALLPDALLTVNDGTDADDGTDDADTDGTDAGVEDASACHRERRANECNDDSGESSPKLAVRIAGFMLMFSSEADDDIMGEFGTDGIDAISTLAALCDNAELESMAE
jgi:hypothetical protein